MSNVTNLKGRRWIGVMHIQNFINAGLTEEQYMNPQLLAQYLIETWEDSGKGRQAGVAICISADGKYHAHLSLYGNTTLKNVAKIMFMAHIEPQFGTKAELTAYLLKEGKYAEKGEQVLYVQGLDTIQDEQGNRSDIDYIEQLIKDGYTPEQIFTMSFRYRRFEKMVKAAYLAKRIKETPLIKTMNNEWHFGPSGSGKTYHYVKLCEQLSPDEVYLCNDYANSGGSAGGFDFYANTPAKIVVLDEFRGDMGYAQLLSMLDVYSRNQQHCRYQNTYNLWESVIICTIYSIEDVYNLMVPHERRDTDSFQQLRRRINTIVYHYVNDKGEYKSFSLPAKDYYNAEHMIELAQQEEMKLGNIIPKTAEAPKSKNPFYSFVKNASEIRKQQTKPTFTV